MGELHSGLSWSMEAKNETAARDEWRVMVARCLARLGKPPVSLLAGRAAVILLANVVPVGTTLKPAVNLDPLRVLMEVG